VSRRAKALGVVAAFVLGTGLMVPFEATLTRVLGVGLLLAFIVAGMFLIAEPGFLSGEEES
jgi:threonine/homoserine efflux transporter RhtA